MLVYNYHPVTGVYTGASEADKSPLEKDVYLIPAYATSTPPPPVQANFARVFRNGAWGYVSEASIQEPPTPTPVTTSEMVNEERDRRIYAGFDFMGNHYAFDPASKQRVVGAATLAGFAVVAGAQPGDLYWHGGSSPFVWIADDNSLVQMDAPTCFAFGKAAAAHEELHIFAARAIKDTTPIPLDYTDDQYWP